jgi:hypothetical protein
MRRIVWSEYMSLDGVVDEPGEWSIPYFSDDLAQYKYQELFAATPCSWGGSPTRASRQRGRRWRRPKASSR